MVNHKIFSLNDCQYSWKDVLSGSALHGDLNTIIQWIFDGLASLAFAEANGMSLPDGQLQKSSDELRYHLKLITAEETEKWLDSFFLSFDDLTNYLERKLWRKWKEDNEFILPKEFINQPLEKIVLLLWPETIFSNQFYTMVSEFVKRVLSCIDSERSEKLDCIWIDNVLKIFCKNNNISESNLDTFVNEHLLLKEVFDDMVNIEAIYQKKLSEIMATQACEQELEKQKVNLIRFKVAAATFNNINAAREACFCVQQDHEDLDEIADDTGAVYNQQSFLMCDVPANIKDRLFSALPGEVIGPVSDKNGFQVIHVIKKETPTLNDPDILSLIQQRLQESYFTPLIAKHIHWNLKF